MAHYTSLQAQAIQYLRTSIATIIKENWNNLTVPLLQAVGTELRDAIGAIEAMLDDPTVRVQNDPRLGTPDLPDYPTIRKMLKRLQNTVHVLCVLADTIAGGQGAPVTPQETTSLAGGEAVLDQALHNLYGIFPTPSGAETE
ncbi:hypothetical protein DdX_03326 [Ditylenchus destructor]|uniref:Uncharacterized protein n=1 Tax=Ditylenchus destructor TaxID=166010 RepID=A0AAD4RCL4_9BILA|nr:hypothetical protein DdX_03326 [Ditylenchus destructor]